ncbi:MAG: hypothetical protein LBQ47_06090 [Endomicrobium sp.]|jgi:ribonuclease HI|nr:hypothetical protein [Endomicrobium sp.]
MTLCKKELNSKALIFQKELASKGVTLEFGDEDFRDYSLILKVCKNAAALGKLCMYAKPSKNTFSLKKQIKNPDIEKVIDEVWDALNGASQYCAESGIYEAFVDGSYIEGRVGYGAVIYLGEEIKAELSGTLDYTQFRQFGGELKSVVETVAWCKKNKVSKIRINYDYEGIEKFAAGKWTAKNELAKKYADYIKKVPVQIQWRHIKSHTGNSKNDRADALAKSAAKRQNS